MNVLTFILAGGRADELGVLTKKRAKSAMPFLGKYRVIDFTLSNCVNSGLISNIGVLTQYNPTSLTEHIGNGKPWDLDRLGGGVRIYPPYVKRHESNWYRGTADALRQNLNVIKESDENDVLILSADHIYKMNYRHILGFHQESGSDITLAILPYIGTNREKYGFVSVSESGKIIDFFEKPTQDDNIKTNYVFMGIYIFKRALLIDILENLPQEKNDLVFDVIIPSIKEDELKISGYFHYSYWRDIGTLQDYYNANMDMIATIPELNMYDSTWKIHTRSSDSAPVFLDTTAEVINSAIADGAIVKGYVNHSIISSGVLIENNSQVIDSIVMKSTQVGENSEIRYAIIDKGVKIGKNVKLLGSKDKLISIGKAAVINDNVVLQAGAKIEPKAKIDIK